MGMTSASRINQPAILALAASFYAVAVCVFAVRSGNWLLVPPALALPVLLVVSSRAPFIFPLGVYVFLLPFDSVLVVGGSPGHYTSFTKYLGGLCIAVLLFKGLADRSLRRPDPASIWWAVFVALALFSGMWAMNLDIQSYSVRSVTAIGLLALYLTVSSYPLEEGGYEYLKKFIMYGGLAAALYTVYAYSTFLMGSGAEGVRATLATTENMTDPEHMTDPNQFAFSLLIPFGIALHQMLRAKGILKALSYAAILAVMAYVLVITESRGGILGMAVIAAVLLYHSDQRGRALLAALAIVATIVCLAPENYFARIAQASRTGGAGRLDIWKVGVEAFRHNWLLGAGLDNFPVAFDYYSYDVPQARFVGYGRAAHNIFLACAVELGIVGAVVMGYSLLKHYRLIGRSKGVPGDRILLKACFFGTLAQAATLDVIWRKSFWLLWMLIVIHNLAKSRKGNAEDEPYSPVAHVPLRGDAL